MSAQLSDFCIVCSNFVQKRHRKILCNSCNGYIHKKCKVKTQGLDNKNKDDLNCPKCHTMYKYTDKTILQNCDVHINSTTDLCVVCSKLIKKCHKDLACKLCKKYVHKKCTNLKQN